MSAALRERLLGSVSPIAIAYWQAGADERGMRRAIESSRRVVRRSGPAIVRDRISPGKIAQIDG